MSMFIMTFTLESYVDEFGMLMWRLGLAGTDRSVEFVHGSQTIEAMVIRLLLDERRRLVP